MGGPAGSGPLQQWDSATGTVISRHVVPVEAMSLAVHPTRLEVALGTKTGTVELRDLGTGEVRRSIKSHPGTVSAVAYLETPDGGPGERVIASGLNNPGSRWDFSHRARVWDLDTEEEVIAAAPYQGMGLRLSPRFSPSGRYLAGRYVSTGGSQLLIWDLLDGTKRPPLSLGKAILDQAALDQEGRRALVNFVTPLGERGRAEYVELATGKVYFALTGHADRVTAVAISPDGKRLATGSYDQTIRLWDAATGQELLTLRGHTADIRKLMFSRDGRRLVSQANDGTVRVWDGTPVE
jgi:WD40 repeat protein